MQEFKFHHSSWVGCRLLGGKVRGSHALAMTGPTHDVPYPRHILPTTCSCHDRPYLRCAILMKCPCYHMPYPRLALATTCLTNTVPLLRHTLSTTCPAHDMPFPLSIHISPSHWFRYTFTFSHFITSSYSYSFANVPFDKHYLWIFPIHNLNYLHFPFLVKCKHMFWHSSKPTKLCLHKFNHSSLEINSECC